MTEEPVRNNKSWRSCSLRPEFRGPDFPGTEDFPEGWFRDGVLVTTDGTVHHSVEPHQIEISETSHEPSIKAFAILLSQ